MEKGIYSYRDYSEEPHFIYVSGSDERYLYNLPASFYVWLKENQLEKYIDTYEMNKLPVHLPYLQKELSYESKMEKSDILSLVSLSEDQVEEAWKLYSFVSDFESIYNRDSTEERFRTIVPKYQNKVESKNLAFVIAALYEKYVTDENKFRLYLHCGIQRYLLLAKERKMLK